MYIRVVESTNGTHMSLIMAKMKVPPIKRLTIPHLELNGALLAARLLHHCRNILGIPLSSTFGWTDSTTMLSWLCGDPSRLKPFVGNCVSQIVELITSSRWRHVPGISNPADRVSRGLYPQELADCEIWWKGPDCLQFPQEEWPEFPQLIERPLYLLRKRSHLPR